MKWKRKDTILLIIVMAIIATPFIILRIASPEKKVVARVMISEGEAYDIVGDITTGGMFIRWDMANDILKEQNINREELWKHFHTKGRLPQEFDKEIKQMINPSFLEFENAYKMYVKFDIAVGDTTLKVRVNTRGYDKTLAYYLAVEQGRREPPSVSAGAETDTFPSSEARVNGSFVVGTPYNFVPIFPGEADAIPKQ